MAEKLKALIINCSSGYNLATYKLRDWLKGQGYEVFLSSGHDSGLLSKGIDLVCLSVVFSWDAKRALKIALRARKNSDIWCGGPGMFALANWWKKETGLECQKGIDWRFERIRGDYKMTFASRGCPVNCSFCIVPRIEGVDFTLDWDFIPAPVLCDNNLSALPVEFQEHIIQRYRDTNTPLLDANSGFEPRTFDEGTYRRWKPILKGAWRFAFDTTSEEQFVRPMMHILRNESGSKKRVYVLIGNEPINMCYERIRKVIEWGGEPFCQPLMALNALDKHPIIRYDWTEQKLMDMARWANRWLWRTVSLYEYQPRKYESNPFVNLRPWAGIDLMQHSL